MHSYRQIESIQRRIGAVIDDLLTRGIGGTPQPRICAYQSNLIVPLDKLKSLLISHGIPSLSRQS
jgi:hypothetical protein